MTILVAGATGNVGRHVVAHLAAAGEPVRALSRDPQRARAKLPAGVEIVGGNLADPQSLVPALEGVTAAHLITFDGEGYAPLETGADIVSLLEHAGVKRVTVLAGRGGNIEDALRESGLAWTRIEPLEFMSGVFDWIEEIKTEGVVRAPFSDVRSAMVHDADIGAVIAKVLTEDGHGKTYRLTGPHALTVPEKVAAIAEGLGREIRYIELTEAEARANWAAQGLPSDVIEFFVMVHGKPNEMAYTVLPTVEQVTGRPARTLVDFVREHADRFA
jgi:uncharacterized protein YbjT (DUF2867 family)